MLVNQCGNGQGVNFQGFLKLKSVERFVPGSLDWDTCPNFRFNPKNIIDFHGSNSTSFSLPNGQYWVRDVHPDQFMQAMMKVSDDVNSPNFIVEI